MRRIFGLGLIACVCASGLGVLLADTKPPFEVPFHYPGADFLPMGDKLAADGLSRRLYYARSNDAPTKIADYFEARWRAQGYGIERETLDSQSVWVGATSTLTPERYSLLVEKQGTQSVLLISSHSARERATELRIPILESCTLLSDSEAHERGVYTAMAFLRCKAYASEVLQFYSRQLDTEYQAPLESVLDLKHSYVVLQNGTQNAQLVYSEVVRDAPETALSIVWQEREP